MLLSTEWMWFYAWPKKRLKRTLDRSFDPSIDRTADRKWRRNEAFFSRSFFKILDSGSWSWFPINLEKDLILNFFQLFQMFQLSVGLVRCGGPPWFMNSKMVLSKMGPRKIKNNIFSKQIRFFFFSIFSFVFQIFLFVSFVWFVCSLTRSFNLLFSNFSSRRRNRFGPKFVQFRATLVIFRSVAKLELSGVQFFTDEFL